MSEKNRGTILALLVAVEGTLLLLIGFAGMDQLVGFGSGFGAAMVVLGLIETSRRLRTRRISD